MLSNRYKFDGKSFLKLNSVQKKVKNRINSNIKAGAYLFEKVKCVVCDNNNFEKLSEKDRYGLYMPVVICRDCGLIQTNPRMTNNSYNLFYQTEYQKLHKGKSIPSRDFFSGQYDRGGEIYKFLKSRRLLPISRKKPILLEIGCGAGGVLQNFKEKGFQVYGRDLGVEYIEFGIKNYGLNLTVGPIQNLEFKEKPNLIIYSHVLEHILHQKTELKEVRELLTKENSVLYIEVPGLKNIVNRNSDFLNYLQIAHVYHFSLSTLRNLMLNNGFELIYGNEKIQSIWRRSNLRKSQIINNYSRDVKYLKNLETYRKITDYPKVLLLNILKKLHLYKVSKKLYNRFRYSNI